MAPRTEEKNPIGSTLWPGERNFILLISGLSFWAGTMLAERLQAGWWLWVAFLMAVVLGILLRRLGRRGGAALALAMLALGGLRTLPRLNPPVPPPGKYESITGAVYGEARLRADNRLTFTLTDVTLDGVSQPGRAYCSLHYGDGEPPALFDGADIAFSGRTYLPEGKSGAPRFDFRGWMLKSGMGYGIAISQGVRVRNAPENAPVKDWASRVRSAFRDALGKVMGERAGMAMAMLLGEKEGVSEEEYAAFQRLGVAHIMSVSGFHVGILGCIAAWLLGKLRLRRGLELIPLAAFLFLYCGLTGFSAASLRAGVMLMIANLCRLWGRSREPLTTIGASMLAVLLIDPLQGTAPGFVLSFTAVAGILTVAPGIRRWLERLFPEGRHRAGRPRNLGEWADRFAHGFRMKAKAGFAASLAAQLGVLLPGAMYYHAIPLYGVAVNMAIIPLASLLIPAFGGTLLLSFLPGIGAWAGYLAARGCDCLLWLVETLSRLPYASVRVSSPGALAAAGGMLALVILSRTIRGGFLRKGLAAALTVGVAAGAAYALRPPDVRYVQLAVGQADAALVFDRDQTVAIDVGADGSATLDYLMDTGRNLDALILTHLHADHIGGVQTLLDAGIQIKEAYLPLYGERQRVDQSARAVLDLLENAGIPVTPLSKGDALGFRDTEMRVFWPDGERIRAGQDANDLPLVLDIDLGGFHVLNAADLTGRYENYAVTPCDVLKAAHHGSAKSTSDAFLDAANPGYAIISCSSGSRSLPGAAMLERLESHGIPAFRTDQSGDVTLWAEEGRLMLSPYKNGRTP